MEDAEDIERDYEKALETAEKEFFNQKKDKNIQAEAEKQYRYKLKAAKQEYERRYSSYIKNQKKNIPLKKSEKKGKEEFKRFKAPGSTLKGSKKEKFSERLEVLKFRIGIKKRSFFQKIVPSWISISYLKLKITLKRLGHSISKASADISTKSIEQAGNAYTKTKETLSKIISGIKKGLEFLYSAIVKIFRKKTEESQKSEDQKIAERILSRTSSP